MINDIDRYVIGGASPIWADPDNAYGYDDIALYSTALTQVQVKQIISDKLDIPVKIGATGYTTFSSTFALDLANLPEGLTAYKASSAGETDIVLEAVNAAVTAGTGLVFAGTANTTYKVPVAASATALAGNLLVGSPDGTTLAANANQYVLVNNGGTAEFQSLKTVGATIPAGKAYLNVPGAGANLRIVIADGEATAIKSLGTAAEEADGVLYNVAGQRVDASYKGIVIKNGKKYLRK